MIVSPFLGFVCGEIIMLFSNHQKLMVDELFTYYFFLDEKFHFPDE